MPTPIRVKSTNEPVFKLVDVTAEIAEQWLSKTLQNRHRSPQIVNGYANDMLAGDWSETGEAIKFDWNGSLIDGQHRLAAILVAARTDPFISIRTWAVWGLSPTAQNFMDSGKKRSPADSLTLDGVKNATWVAAAAKLMYRIDNEAFFGARTGTTVTTAQIRNWLADNPDFEAFISAHKTVISKTLAPPSVTAAALWMMSLRDSETAEEFLSSLYSLANLPEGHPVILLHKRLSYIRSQRQKLPQKEHLAIFFQAWNLMRTGRTVSRLYQPSKGWTAENFPWPR